MKIPFTLLILLALLTQCTKEELPVTGRGSLNQDAEISLNQTIELTGGREENAGADKIYLTFEELKDSRCPMNAFCIRNGSAIGWFKLKKGNKETERIGLVIGDALPSDTRPLRSRSADTTLVLLGNKHYQVIMKNITPYPCAGCPNQEVPKASIIISGK